MVIDAIGEEEENQEEQEDWKLQSEMQELLLKKEVENI